MLILSSDQIKKSDQFTIENEPISSLDLMERAASKCFDEINSQFTSAEEYFLVIAGPGNNGGDGLVIARLLKNANRNVSLILLGEKFSEDNLKNQGNWKKIEGVILGYESLDNELKKSSIVIDCIFGTGLNKAPDGNYKNCIQKINESKKRVISIDIPSGMTDSLQYDFKLIIKAEFTYTFQFPKLSFLLPDSGIFAGNWKVLDIGLLEEGFIHEKPIGFFISKDLIKNNFTKRKRFTHKGTFGHACLIGGSYGKMGAMILAGKSCLKSGVGLTTLVILECGYEILQSSIPEAMVRVSAGNKYLEEFNIGNIKYDAMGIGPGMGMEKETADALKFLIQNSVAPLIIDADALNILSENKTWLHFLPAGSILSPHPKEFERLVGSWDSSFEMIELQKAFTFKFQCIVILKGAYTSISTPGGNLFFNSTGNPGLAKGGSGDTLTGIITSLCAQGFSSLEAALSGVYLHGLAADLAIKNINENSLLASDVIDYISEAISEIQS